MRADDDPRDDLTDADEEKLDDVANEWIGRVIALPLRRSVVRALLRGNDAQCFTTEQYRAAYAKEADAVFRASVGKDRPDPGCYWPDGLAESHLRSTGLVREAAPGVWAPAEGERP